MSDGVATCSVAAGSTVLSIDATSLQGGGAVVTIEVDGTSQLAGQVFNVLSFDDNEFIDAVLLSATADPATGQVELRFEEAFASAVELVGTFTLSRVGDVSVLDETVRIVPGPGLPPGVAAEGRIYVVTDFDLEGTSIDASVTAASGGTLFTQTDGSTTATLEVLGVPPTAHQVAACCELEEIFDDVAIALDGTNSVPGPADFQQAVSWDRSISSTTPFETSLRTTIQLPEPSSVAAALSAGLPLLALAALRKGRRR